MSPQFYFCHKFSVIYGLTKLDIQKIFDEYIIFSNTFDGMWKQAIIFKKGAWEMHGNEGGRIKKISEGTWIKTDQLDVTCFVISLFNAKHVSELNTSILRSLRLICWVISWVILLWFDVCWCYVVVFLWWCGIRMQASACIRIPHHPNQTTT